ncbi:hypothetical protein [Pseudonocardia hydrocarbonoxydans]|uniref:Uncharacterized protein n=1 Tax=Pseudonocardia hydrocarbonoxydans TaxID=76726 RepID=A0A4Y3WSK8_9PSEU|nr:hypothetical protein [Pseudonocardia hydrocarbonoxydans]GEC21857.1 hypothetical protein PHY01_41400 [Pseudonocardia hydrocarbonoxydans]
MTTPDGATVEQELPGGWTAVMRWDTDVPVPGRGPVTLEIRPTDPADPPPNGLSSTVLRDVSFPDAYRQLRGRGTLSAAERFGTDSDPTTRLLRKAASDGLTDRYLAMLAAAYLVLVNAEHDRPHDALARAVGKTPATVKHHLWQAQRRELFERSHGRKGGALTEKARRAALPDQSDDTWRNAVAEHRRNQP